MKQCNRIELTITELCLQIREPELKATLDALKEVIMYPWWTNPHFQVIYKSLCTVYWALEKYHKSAAEADQSKPCIS